MWNESVYDPIIKRPCECLCCNGCKTNSCCEIFVANICPIFVQSVVNGDVICVIILKKHICKYDLRDWQSTLTTELK